MNNNRLSCPNGAIRASCEVPDSLEPHGVQPDASSLNLEIAAPGGIGLKLNAQGRATVIVLAALLIVGTCLGIGGSVFLKGNQSNLPSAESRD